MLKYPELTISGNKISLLSDGKPFLILGGEIHNSSASDLDYMQKTVWPSVRDLNLNTLIVPIYWECLEPEDGVFDFTLPDGLIGQAEQEGKKLVFLWFGLWKNGMSTYVPVWMKRDRETYFAMQDRYGKPVDAVSPLCSAAVERDAAAFGTFMKHLKTFDQKRTVLMVQVENEMGLLGDCRDFSPAAEKLYYSEVPDEIAALYHVKGNWEQAFGEEGPERFMTYCYAKATEKIASAGRKKYPIPLYINAWLEQYPWTPGTYPTGGPIARHMDMWKAFAPSIDFLSPDIYLPDFESVCEQYTALGNPLFIPEARPSMDSASNVFSAFGRFGALGMSPFAIDEVGVGCLPPDCKVLEQLNIMPEAFNFYRAGEYLAKSYGILSGMTGLLEEYRATPHMMGFTYNSNQRGTLVKFEKYNFLIEYPPNGTESPKGGGLIIELSEDEFVLCGVNFRAVALPKDHDRSLVETISITEGCYQNDEWVAARKLNGDEFNLEFRNEPRVLRCQLIRRSV